MPLVIQRRSSLCPTCHIHFSWEQSPKHQCYWCETGTPATKPKQDKGLEQTYKQDKPTMRFKAASVAYNAK